MNVVVGRISSRVGEVGGRGRGYAVHELESPRAVYELAGCNGDG